MLYEMYCDKFRTNYKNGTGGTERGRITFKTGLNVVQGENSAKNSIGKSSFLLAIDFAFGGDDYANDEAIINVIGHHAIRFCFVFNNTPHYFSRSTEKEKGEDGKDRYYVYKCNENYAPQEKITITQFRDFLLKGYNITLPQTTFRGVVSLFSRIAGRDTVKDQTQPLTNDIKEPIEKSLVSFLKLHNLYMPIEQNKIEKDKKEKYKDALVKANTNKVIKLVSKKGYEENKQRIEELQSKLIEIENQGSVEFTMLDEDTTEKAMELKSEFEAMSKKKRVLWAKYYAIEKAAAQRKPPTQEDFEELTKYFPDSRVQEMAAIENFHKQLSLILMNEFKTAKSSLIEEINKTATEMESLEKQMQEINLPQQISKKTIKTCGEIYSEITKLQNENYFYEEKAKIDIELKNAVTLYTQIFLQQFAILQPILNAKLETLNNEVYGNKKKPPTLNVLQTNSYKYQIENDKGTGMQYKNVILLDLACLELVTQLPTLIHDTIMYKQIEKPAMSKIVELYLKSNKQIFIAFDETTNYSDEAQSILLTNKILTLSYGGNELFGWSWNEKIDEETEV